MSHRIIDSRTNVGCRHDGAENLLDQGACPAPGGIHTYVYDNEDRLAQTAGTGYAYDGDGKRVAKSSGKLYWTGMGSDALDESDASGNINEEYVFFNGKRIARMDVGANNAVGAVHYYFSDHLGSASVVTNADGSKIEEESDYYPFGGERVVTAGPNVYKFTGKERDSESGLDYFEARHYSSALGRFMQPDELTGGPVDLFDDDGPAPSDALPYADITNPQSLNKYAYTYNNPLRYADPNGHDAWDVLKGALNATANDVVGTPRLDGNQDFRVGQVTGDIATTAAGTYESLQNLTGSVALDIGTDGIALVTAPAQVIAVVAPAAVAVNTYRIA